MWGPSRPPHPHPLVRVFALLCQPACTDRPPVWHQPAHPTLAAASALRRPLLFSDRLCAKFRSVCRHKISCQPWRRSAASQTHARRCRQAFPLCFAALKASSTLWAAARLLSRTKIHSPRRSTITFSSSSSSAILASESPASCCALPMTPTRRATSPRLASTLCVLASIAREPAAASRLSPRAEFACRRFFRQPSGHPRGANV